MDAIAIVESSFNLKIRGPEAAPPMSAGGLTHRDIVDLLDLGEVLVMTNGSLQQSDRESRLREIDHMRGILHYRFDKSCDHGPGCIRQGFAPVAAQYAIKSVASI
jgi:hypothetical protein